MKILHLLNTLDIGGAEILVMNLARHVDADRFKLTVGSLGTGGELAGQFRDMGVPTVSFGRRTGIDWRLVGRLAAYIRQNGIAAVHTHNATPWLYGGLAARLCGARLFHTEHSNLFRGNERLMTAERWLSRLTRDVICVSHTVRERLIKGQGLDPSRVRTIHNGVDVSLYAPRENRADVRAMLGLTGSGPVIGTVGRLVAVKDQSTLIKAFAVAGKDHPDARLLLVGDGPLATPLREQAAASGMGDRIVFAGRRDDVAQVLQAMDVFVLSSVSEGLPLTILEAMACGLPVVATRVGGNPEAVVADETGILVAPGVVEELAAAMGRLLRDAVLRSRMGQAGRARAQQHFDLAAMTRAYQDAYTN